jgi:hypothetical protein
MCPSSFEENPILDSIYDEMLAHQQPRKTAPVAGAPAEMELSLDAPPALPQKSALRASRMLSGFADLKQSTTTSTTTANTLAQAEPHEVYLSSEEDASSSADDFSDYDSMSEAEEESAKRRKSQEDTARVVSVIFSGRPSIVSVSPNRAASPASSLESDSAPAPRPLERAATDSSLATSSSSSSSRRLSISSIGSMSLRHPPRTSSMYFTTGSPTVGGKKKPTFLNIDPYASTSKLPIEEEEHQESYDTCSSPVPRTPKTPSAMFRRGLSLVKKRSRPLLSNFGPVEPLPATMPALQIQTSIERTSYEPSLHTPVSAVHLPQGDFHFDTFLAKPVRKVSTPVSTPISTPITPTTMSPAGSTTNSPAKGSIGRGRLLGFRRQSLSLRAP